VLFLIFEGLQERISGPPKTQEQLEKEEVEGGPPKKEESNAKPSDPKPEQQPAPQPAMA
jgi:HAE1 family hydrophobic/amphiphilic exporter-1